MPGEFGPGHLLGVSEVGVAVPDVLDAVAQLHDAGVEPYGNPPGAGFAAVGDAEGMLILVTAGRAWMPTTDRHAEPSAVAIRAEGIRAVRLDENQKLLPADPTM
jgi:hypothetical protein